ncbi:MAG TPA: DUF4932 domain-containing protein [Roseiflexaceae bacterium]|nr:DUF4932 domain-containing protein [Roseiflexaceae bacterium]
MYRVFLLLALVLAGCSDGFRMPVGPVETSLPAATALPSDPAARLMIAVDPRIELLTTVMLLSGRPICGRALNSETPYARRVAQHFGAYADHEAVHLLRTMRDNDFNCDAPISAMLYLSDPPDLVLGRPLSDAVAQRAGGAAQFDILLAALRDFARVTHFADFFAAESGTYARIVADVTRLSNGEQNVRLIESYYGMRAGSYRIILAPLLSREGFGPRIPRGDGSSDVYGVVGAAGLHDGLPSFGAADDFQYLIWHEFSHSFVNPLAETYLADVERLASRYPPIAEQMERQAYRNWETALNEHIVRAVTVRLTTRELGAAAGAAAAARERERGFIYLDRLTAQLERYEQQRERYSSLADFYPEILAALME